jgi:A/G-specific adenine glycosylase
VEDENENTVIQKRTSKGIWQNLYEFRIETDKVEDFEYVYGQVQENYFKIMSWFLGYNEEKYHS